MWSIVICDSDGGVEKDVAGGGYNPENESEIMILASLQFRYTITSAYVYSASVCVLTGTATATKVQGEMAIPSCQPDLQVSGCTSA